MKVLKSWGVFISQTGTEVIDISKELGILPSLIITNNITKISQKNLEIFGKHGVTIHAIPFRPTPEQYLIPELLEKELITLHGFLRILPPVFINTFKGKIYNGHPGLITFYPELKGKDPQIRAWGGRYEYIGSVVHEVTEGVDEGAVISSELRENTVKDLNEMYLTLKDTSLLAWKTFFINNWIFA